MINVRRFPGVLYRHKTQFGLLFFCISSVFYLMHRWGFVCTNQEIKREMDRLCELYKAGEAVGNLCKPLCVDKKVHSMSCISQHSKKPLVFTAKWNQRLIVIKSSATKPQRLKNVDELWNDTRKIQNTYHSRDRLESNIPKSIPRRSKRKTEDENPEPKLQSYPKHFPRSKRIADMKNEAAKDVTESTEEEFEKAIRNMVSEKLNLTLTRGQLDDLKYLDLKNRLLYSEVSEERRIEKKNVFNLLQSQEYLLSRLFSDRDIFPQILGTCGHFYGVEYLESPRFNSMFTLDDKAEWSERMKLAVSVMDFVEEVETNFPDALHLCDVQMNHLGITSSGRIKFLDLDFVFLKNIIDKILRSGQRCKEDKDCDLLDCKSTCNLKDGVCDEGVANDNLQVICEKIFIGWTMSGKMIVPGLLMSEYTPASLSALLRLCSEVGRKPVPEDLRQRLYTTLTEMHQILIQKLLE